MVRNDGQGPQWYHGLFLLAGHRLLQLEEIKKRPFPQDDKNAFSTKNGSKFYPFGNYRLLWSIRLISGKQEQGQLHSAIHFFFKQRCRKVSCIVLVRVPFLVHVNETLRHRHKVVWNSGCRFIQQARPKLLCLQASLRIHEPFFRMEGIELEISLLLTFSWYSLIQWIYIESLVKCFSPHTDQSENYYI